MKTYRLAGLVLLAGCGLFISAKADTLNINPPSAGDFTAFDTDFDGNGNSIDATSATTLTVGELDNASNNRLDRTLLRFNMPAIPEGQQIVSATLTLYVISVVNSGSLTNAELYWSNDASTTLKGSYSSSYYQNGTFTDTGLAVATPATAAGTTVSLDVTSFVQSDYINATGSTIYTWFRIQADGTTYIEDNQSNRYTFASVDNGTSGFHPELTIVTAPIPEPATYGLILLSGIIGLTAWKRRSFTQEKGTAG